MREFQAAEPVTPQPTGRTSRTGARFTLARNLIAIAAWGFFALVVVQFYLSGVGVFRGNFELHRNFGYLLQLIALVVLVLLIAVRAQRRQIWLAVAVLVLSLLQSVFILVRTSSPDIAALHPVNAVAILVASLILARTTWRLGGFTEL